MKINNFVTKLGFFIIAMCIFLILYCHLDDVLILRHKIYGIKETSIGKDKEENMKYILQWTNPSNIPFVYMGKGQSTFIDKKCPYVNCYVTADRNYLSNYTDFDVIAFAGPEVVNMLKPTLPMYRSPHQRYVFASIESSGYYPVCSNRFDGYFNWTWTYKLNSHLRWGYFLIKNMKNEIIGPKEDMQWMRVEDMRPISKQFRRELINKKKIAAWFVSNCKTASKREEFVNELQFELYGYGLIIDIFGGCGYYNCPRDTEFECDKKIQQNYYFYLAFENALTEDYVTEKLLRALNNDAVPIVYGGANYTRFMPDGIYLNALQLGAKKLAAKMNELIKNPIKYYDYFRWKNYYKYETMSKYPDTDEYCKMCAMLNNADIMKKTTVNDNFQQWWDPPGSCAL